jgi:vacuolar-type H+-ATPase subunit H
MTVPHSETRPDLQIVRGEAPMTGGSPSAGRLDDPEAAFGLLENAQRVADATVAEAKAEAERLLGAARERAAQVQHDAREMGDRLRADAERESAEVKHRAFGEAERIVADAKARVGELESTIGGLESNRDQALTSVRDLSDRLNRLLFEHDASPG